MTLFHKLIILSALIGAVVGAIGGVDLVSYAYLSVGAIMFVCAAFAAFRVENGGLQAFIPLLYSAAALFGVWVGDHGLAGVDWPWQALTMDGKEILR